MKMMARRAYLFSFVFMLPMVLILSRSNAGRLIEKSSIDSVAQVIKTGSVDVKRSQQSSKSLDSMLHVIFSLQKQTSFKLDTGLKRQKDYIRSQNFLAIKVIEMSETIQDLKLKSAIPAQVAKDAQTGNEKKKIYRLLLGTFIATWLLVGLVYAIFVKKTSPVHIHIHNPL